MKTDDKLRRELRKAFPTLSATTIDYLVEDSPRYIPFVERGDKSIGAAVRRYARAVRLAVERLEQRGEAPQRRFLTAEGLMTTSIKNKANER